MARRQMAYGNVYECAIWTICRVADGRWNKGSLKTIRASRARARRVRPAADSRLCRRANLAAHSG